MQEQEKELSCLTFQYKTDCQAWKNKQKCPKDCPYLEGNWQKSWLPHYPKDSRKHRRAFQRMMTGLQIAQNNHAFMRFMTLTTALEQKRPIKKSFAVLRLRIERATYENDGFEGFKFNRYFCLRTSEGNGVLHIVFWGRFIPQAWLSRNWLDIHGAHRADIRACYTKRNRVNGLVSYLLTNYLNKQPIERMSYGCKWAWLGFCKSWKNVKDCYSGLRRGKGEFGVKKLVSFHDYYSNKVLDAWHCTLWEHPATTKQVKLSGAKSLKWFLPELASKVKKRTSFKEQPIGCQECPNLLCCSQKLTEEKKDCAWFVGRGRKSVAKFDTVSDQANFLLLKSGIIPTVVT